MMAGPAGRSSRTRWIAAATLALAALAAGGVFVAERENPSRVSSGASAPVVTVPVTSVVRKTVPVYLDYVGTMDAIRAVTLQAQVTGYLLKRLMPDGADVKAGDLLYQIDPRPYQAVLAQAQANLARDQAQLANAQRNVKRDAPLLAKDFVSRQQFDTDSAAAAALNATVKADQAAVKSAQLNLDYTQIRAPFDGRLSYSRVQEGALITTAGTQLNMLVQLDPIYATFNPPDTDLPEIEAHQTKAPIPAEVIVGEGKTPPYRGELTFLDNNIERGTSTITARATIRNPDRTLLPGQFVRVRLHLADQADALLLPQVAVNSSQLGKYVYVVGPDGKVEQRVVALGADYPPWVVVNKGVAEGERVAVGNFFSIAPGVIVRPVISPTALQTSAGQ